VLSLTSRRSFLRESAATFVAYPHRGHAASSAPLDAIAFDGLVIFDLRPLLAITNELFPGRGKELINLWSARQFEYAWLRSLAARYADFWRVSKDSLTFAAHALGIELNQEAVLRIMDNYRNMKCWPEVPDALLSLKRAGMRLALLSNMTAGMMDAGIRRSGLTRVFNEVLSTDRVRIYKPGLRAYEMGVHALRIPKERILFVASAGWDAFGAKAFGYPVYWVNRQRQPQEELGVTPDGAGATLDDLRDWIARGMGTSE